MHDPSVQLGELGEGVGDGAGYLVSERRARRAIVAALRPVGSNASSESRCEKDVKGRSRGNMQRLELSRTSGDVRSPGADSCSAASAGRLMQGKHFLWVNMRTMPARAPVDH